MPAFCAAMSSSAAHLFGVIQADGCQHDGRGISTLVASSRPPSLVSMIAMSTFSSANTNSQRGDQPYSVVCLPSYRLLFHAKSQEAMASSGIGRPLIGILLEIGNSGRCTDGFVSGFGINGCQHRRGRPLPFVPAICMQGSGSAANPGAASVLPSVKPVYFPSAAR